MIQFSYFYTILFRRKLATTISLRSSPTSCPQRPADITRMYALKEVLVLQYVYKCRETVAFLQDGPISNCG